MQHTNEYKNIKAWDQFANMILQNSDDSDISDISDISDVSDVSDVSDISDVSDVSDVSDTCNHSNGMFLRYDDIDNEEIDLEQQRIAEYIDNMQFRLFSF